MQAAPSLKSRLQSGTRAVGCMLALRAADIAEILALAGFDFLFIDHEHGPGSVGDAIDQMRAIKGTGAASLVRVPANDPACFQRVLDAGADGVVCPAVESAAEAEAVVRACRFPPQGRRGAGANTRAALYGFDAAFPAGLEERLLIAVQIESVRGIEHIEAIADVPGIDAIFIGPRDLSSSIGKLHQFQDPELLALIEEAETRILATGKFMGSSIYPGLTVAAMFAKGYRILVAGTDAGLLAQAARAVLAQPR